MSVLSPPTSLRWLLEALSFSKRAVMVPSQCCRAQRSACLSTSACHIPWSTIGSPSSLLFSSAASKTWVCQSEIRKWETVGVLAWIGFCKYRIFYPRRKVNVWSTMDHLTGWMLTDRLSSFNVDADHARDTLTGNLLDYGLRLSSRVDLPSTCNYDSWVKEGLCRYVL